MTRLGDRHSPFDVLIIGGGIVGAGVARDAAMRGLRTLLVEQADFASGTSSRSSRLLHGGLRYLAQGRIGLVREASTEKVLLGRLAPHLCSPMPFVFPVWKGDQWSLWKLAAGVHVYDLLCGRRNFGRSCFVRSTRLTADVPQLRREGLKGAVRYFDAFTNDARLVIDTLRSAEGFGASLLNYAKLLSAERRGSEWHCEVRNESSGSSFEVHARAIVNAAGAWADRLPHAQVHLRLTKGVHLVIDRARLPVSEAFVLSERDRILFVIPWGERMILGTTDTDYTGDPSAVQTERADVDYILRVVNDAFPAAGLAASDVISSWAGIRPLIAPRSQKAGAPSDISRGHQITVCEPAWVDVAGGKLTTYRLMAEQTVDRVGECLGMRLQVSRTAHVPIPAPPDRISGVLPPALSRDVVRHCCHNEWAVHLDDLLMRRTSWSFYRRDQSTMAESACSWMAEELGWSAERKAAEMKRFMCLAGFQKDATELRS
jgi:glycerol-3-phosphate dehydrogenase